jgi:hypothetical protein
VFLIGDKGQRCGSRFSRLYWKHCVVKQAANACETALAGATARYSKGSVAVDC